MTLNSLMNQMWTDYCRLNPQADQIQSLISAQGEVIVNDHIALRTFAHPKINIAAVANANLK